MPISPTPFLLSLLLTFLLPFTKPDPDPLSELQSLRSTSPSGVIHLNDNLLRRLLVSPKPPRPYSLLIFFDAAQLHNKPDLHLQSLKSEFHLLSLSFLQNNQIQNPSSLSKLFFCTIEFAQSQSSFALFGVNSLPHIRLVGPTDSDLKAHSLKMDAGDFSRLAESMADFVESKTSLVVGPIQRPPLLSAKHFIIIGLTAAVALPFLVKRVVSGETVVHDWRLWLSGAVFVYFFSVSGAMHNIIRKMPMFIADRNDPNKLVFFYQGSGMQLGAEGFAVGFLYTIVGLLLALMTNVLVWVRNATAQRVVMIVALFVSFLAVKQVVFLDNWKTGYGVHAYWPSRWT